MAKLLQVDDVAYVRFARVRQFKDVSQFVEEIKTSSASPRPNDEVMTPVRSFPARVHAAGAAPGTQRAGRTAPTRRSARSSYGGRVVGKVSHAAGFPTPRSRRWRARERGAGADLYVTLEPCDHRGRTGPCTGAILAAASRVWRTRWRPNPAVPAAARAAAPRRLVVHRG